MREAPPGNGKGLDGSDTAKALINTPRRPRQRSADEDIGSSAAQVNTCSGAKGENLPRSARHLPARLKAAIAAERSTPKMHWRWRRRGHDIVALLQSRFGSALPNDDAGIDAAKLLAQHYMRLNIDAERVTRANLRLYASWLTEKPVAGIIKGAKKAKTPSASQLGKHWRVTAGEVASLGLSTITAFTVTLEGDRVRQARRRRKAGATKKRGRPKSEGIPAWKAAGFNSPRTYYRHKAREAAAAQSGTENSHAVAYIRGMKRDGISVPRPIEVPSVFVPFLAPTPPGRTAIVPALIGGERLKRAAAEITAAQARERAVLARAARGAQQHRRMT